METTNIESNSKYISALRLWSYVQIKVVDYNRFESDVSTMYILYILCNYNHRYFYFTDTTTRSRRSGMYTYLYLKIVGRYVCANVYFTTDRYVAMVFGYFFVI